MADTSVSTATAGVDLDYKWKKYATSGLRLDAIRIYRDVYSTGLVESKYAVESFIDILDTSTEAKLRAIHADNPRH